MISAEFDLNDLKRFAARAKNWEKGLQKEIAKDLAETAINIDREAKQRAPVNNSFLRNGQYIEKRRGGLTYNIGNRMPYAPYQEFGTGRKVSLAELTKTGLPPAFAAKFRGKGIKQVNIKPQPFFFPAVNQELPKSKKRFEQTIKRHGRTF